MDKPSFRVVCGIFLLQLMHAAGVCHAENLPDPTRPPASLWSPYPSFGEDPGDAPASVPVLQSIMLSATRKVAIISGQAVALGEKFGDARLVKLSQSEAVLRTAGGLQVLRLFPDVDKKERLVPQDEDKNGRKTHGAVTGKKVKQ